MRLAVLNINGISQDFEHQKRYYYIVDNNYDFVSNDASDVSDMIIFKRFFYLNRLTFIDYRNSIKYYYENDMSSNWSLASNKEKFILVELYLVDKSKRDEIFNDDEQKIFVEQIINFISNTNKSQEADVIYSNDNIDSYISKSNNISFGKDYYYSENDYEENTNKDWVEHTSLVISDLQNGKYRASWYCELSGNRGTHFRVQYDNTHIISYGICDNSDSEWNSFSGFKIININNNNLVLDLDYGVVKRGSTAKIRNARIELWRVN